MLFAATFVLTTLPWLNPFSPGPTPAVMPFLFSWLCIALAAPTLVAAHLRGRTSDMVRTVALAWATAACVSAVIGLLQYVGATSWAGVWLNHTDVGQAFGNLRQRNQFASLLAIGLAALLWWAAHSESSPRDGDHPQLDRILLVVAATLLEAANAASASRTGLFQLVLIVALTCFWKFKSQKPALARPGLSAVYPILIAAVVGYAVATIALPLLAGQDPMATSALARLRNGDSACGSRLTLWGNVLQLIGQKPWLGWGWGELSYAHFITLYPGTRFCDILDNAHNLPLHLAVELGVPVSLLGCGVILALVWRAKPWRAAPPTRQMAWIVLAVIGLHSLLEYPLWYGPFQMAALLAIWLLWHTDQHAQQTPTHKEYQPVALYLSATAATLLIAAIAYATWNYQLVSQIYLPPEARLAAYRENTLDKTRNVAMFQDQQRFAELTTTELNAENAKKVHALALNMLHFSPESQVVEMLIGSAKLLGKTDEVQFFTPRYQAAFPEAYGLWVAKGPAK